MDATVRLLDASANRAGEALRTLEDVARFVLDDEQLTASLKRLRHEITGALSGVDVLRRCASRDTTGDVGTRISTSSEGERANLRDVAEAAADRAAQALRSLEEAAKVLGLDAQRLERVRYRAYTLAASVVLALGTGRATQYRLCVILTEAVCRKGDWLGVARAAIEGGANCLQLREKALDDCELLARARTLVELARGRGVVVFINDRVDIALLAGADGVHLGQTDLTARYAREIAGGRLLVGVSASGLGQARAAARDGADVCGVGAMFASTTKDKPSVAGVRLMREYLACEQTSRVPHLAIGGITPGNVGELAQVGCRGVAVCASVCGAEDPGDACRALIAGLGV